MTIISRGISLRSHDQVIRSANVISKSLFHKLKPHNHQTRYKFFKKCTIVDIGWKCPSSCQIIASFISFYLLVSKILQSSFVRVTYSASKIKLKKAIIQSMALIFYLLLNAKVDSEDFEV